VVDEGAHRPARLEAGDLEQEVLEDPLPLRRVRDLGMELHGVETAFRRSHRGDRGAPGRGQLSEARRRRQDRVAVAHPHRDAPGGRVRHHALEERIRRLQDNLGPAILPMRTRLDLAAQQQSHRLHAVADAQDGNARLEERRGR
jgi:hypothetical protein